MPDISQPGATPGAAGGVTPPAAGNGGSLLSQGPNDPINPPATGGTGAPATGEPAGEDEAEARAKRNRDEALSRMASERDEARRLLEEERRKNLPPEELARLRQQDEAQKASETRIRGLTLRYEVANRAARLGIVDPELAVLLLEGNKDVTITDAGVVSGLDEALKALIKDRPYLVRAAAAPVDGGAGAGGSRTGSKVGMNDIIRTAARGRQVQQG
jgi:hypothetical protein